MHQTPRMEQRQRRADVARESTRGTPVERRAILQVAAIEQFHRVVRLLTVDSVVEDRHDTRMGELCECMILVLEVRDVSDVVERVGTRAQALERHLHPRFGIDGSVNRSHPACAELPEQLITARHDARR